MLIFAVPLCIFIQFSDLLLLQTEQVLDSGTNMLPWLAIILKFLDDNARSIFLAACVVKLKRLVHHPGVFSDLREQCRCLNVLRHPSCNAPR